MTERAKSLIKRYRSLWEKRGAWRSHADDLARVMLPSRAGFVRQPMEGDRFTDEILDGTPMQAARGLANAIGGIMRPDGEHWVFMEPVDKDLDDEGIVQLSLAENKFRNALDNPKARFRQATGEADNDLVVLGEAVVFTSESDAMDSLLFKAIHPKDAVPFFGEDGQPQGMFRSRKFTVRQAVDKFTLGGLSDKLKKAAEDKKWDDSFEFVHAVVPRKETTGGFAKGMPWASLWIEVETEHEASEGGFREFPFACPRWDTASGEDSGTSPGMIALPDANTLQAMEETLLIAGQRIAAPPLLAPNDGAFDAANTFPDGITYYDAELAKTMGRIPIVPLETGAKMPIVMEMQDRKRAQVLSAFLKNVLNLPIDGPQMTATEVIQRREEFIREIGPVFGRLETDYTAPMIERAFMVMLRAGAFATTLDDGSVAKIHPSLAGKTIRFRYSSPVKKIRQQVDVAAARMWALELIQIAPHRPEILDLIDADEYARFMAEAANVPQRIVVGRDRVERTREARAQQQQAMMQASMLQQAAETGAKVVKALPQQGRAA